MKKYLFALITVFSFSLAVTPHSLAQLSRLTSGISFSFGGSGLPMDVADSTTYIYSGTRSAYLNGVSSGWQYDSSIIYNYNKTELKFDFKEKSIQAFDANGNIAALSSFEWLSASSTWQNIRSDSFTYDSKHLVLSASSKIWRSVASAWTPNTKIAYTYTAENMLATSIEQIWNPTTAIWIYTKRITYTYDGAGKEVLKMTDGWNLSSGSWTSIQRETRTYDASGNLITVLREKQSSGIWENVSKDILSYDASNNCIAGMYYSWDNTTSSFSLDLKEESSSHTGHQPGLTLSMFESAVTSGVFDTLLKKEYIYNSFLQTTAVTEYTRNYPVSPWQYGTNSKRYHYETFVSAVPEVTIASAIKLFPMPARNELFLDITWQQAQAFDIYIHDMKGRLLNIQHVPLCHACNSTVSTRGLPSGSYIVKLAGERESVSRTVVIAK